MTTASPFAEYTHRSPELWMLDPHTRKQSRAEGRVSREAFESWRRQIDLGERKERCQSVDANHDRASAMDNRNWRWSTATDIDGMLRNTVQKHITAGNTEKQHKNRTDCLKWRNRKAARVLCNTHSCIQAYTLTHAFTNKHSLSLSPRVRSLNLQSAHCRLFLFLFSASQPPKTVAMTIVPNQH